MTDSIVFGLDPGNADDLSLQEEAAVAKRSITRSIMPIYRPISTSDRGNRSPHRSLVTTCPRESGCASVHHPRVG
jgi:hypothetical protein